MPHVNRRHMLASLAALGSSSAVPKVSFADGDAVNGYGPTAKQFEKAAGAKPWAIGWRNPSAHQLDTPQIKCTHGNMPEGLNGTFYRNGPAIHERGGRRLNHWFDGDGMIQAFRISAKGVSHVGRTVQTENYLRNEKEERFTAGGFGTKISNPASLSGPDSVNVANTSVLPLNGELLALWEGGSAYAMDRDTLETRGPKVWQAGLEGMPFSAHPKVETNGTVWNFGQDVIGQRLIIYKISPQGNLDKVSLLKDVPGGMIHDFCITDRHLIFVAPSFRAVRTSETYLDRFKWQPGQAQRVIVVDKDDFEQRRDFELPPGFQFHYGNAYTDKNGDIHFSVCTGDASFVLHGAVDVMHGRTPRVTGTNLCHVVLKSNGNAKITQTIEELGDHEFPQFNPRYLGQKNRYLYTVGKTPEGSLVQSALLKHDMETGAIQTHDYGSETLVEEHLFIPKENTTTEDDGWLIGTTLNTRSKVTSVNVLEAAHISDGPIATFELPYALPLGFHGAWLST